MSDEYITVIKESVVRYFGSRVRVLLFGSRVDIHKKGGDIDLLVLTSLEKNELFKARIATLARIHSILGEQKIDIIPWNPAIGEAPLVVQEALEKGVEL
ncbi:hypothetical protein AU468_13610 [Alkalispirochaeta sphaeroplastigenens]|uniref:Polymerase nucleotidyl transferase domain-containing protein n=1 Tax=Alkalispirochaeta sphaeroplastigenens TaxID=1187066 RepID=A0A2S4JFV1_9SPIO|nr:hypothetical protein AU468_13610 [Alkalispirochaeta sphaeroplastigenens]